MREKHTLCYYIGQMKYRPVRHVGVKFVREGRWVSLNWQEYYGLIENIASSFLAAGVNPGDRIAIMSSTRLEWALADLSAMLIKAIVVPIFSSITQEDFEFILQGTKPIILILETKKQFEMLSFSKLDTSFIKLIVVLFEEAVNVNKIKQIKHMTFLEFKNCSKNESFKEKIRSFIDASHFDDVATILYTSGARGKPRGVVLTHRQVMSEISEIMPCLGLSASDTNLTYLPYSHVLGRIEHWGGVYIGFTLAFAESVEKLRNNLLAVKPTVMMGVPRVFEKMQDAIVAEATVNQVKRKLFYWAMGIGKEVSRLKSERKNIPPSLGVEFLLAQKLVFNKILAQFGGRLRFAIVGGAALNQDVAIFFHSLGLQLLEGYGMSETTGAICANTPFDYRFGTVGKPQGDVKIKIAEDGEVLVKSDKVMKEYYGDPKGTQDALSEGWFCTGDIGEILPTGELRITDHKKALFKLTGGVYIAPQKLENLLKQQSYISNAMIYGERKRYVVALLTLNREPILRYAAKKDIYYTDFFHLVKNEQVVELIRQVVAKVNSKLSSYEAIKSFAIIAEDFTVDGGELSPSLKLKRKYCELKYRNILAGLYR